MGQNEELVRRIQDGELYLMGRLWEDNQGLVRYAATRYREGCGRLFDIADLIQAGYLGLHAAAMVYTTERGAAFATYAVFHIRRAMREVAGLRGKRDALFDAHSLDAPIGDDGNDTLLDLVPAPCEDYPIELEELRHIVHVAVSRIRDRKVREAIQAVYRDGITLAEYARKEGISAQGAGERLQRGYAILRKDPSIIGLALAEGYDTEYVRYKGLSAYRGPGMSTVENAVIRQEQAEYQRSVMYQQLEEATEQAERRQAALYRQLGALPQVPSSFDG